MDSVYLGGGMEIYGPPGTFCQVQLCFSPVWAGNGRWTEEECGVLRAEEGDICVR